MKAAYIAAILTGVTLAAALHAADNGKPVNVGAQQREVLKQQQQAQQAVLKEQAAQRERVLKQQQLAQQQALKEQNAAREKVLAAQRQQVQKERLAQAAEKERLAGEKREQNAAAQREKAAAIEREKIAQREKLGQEKGTAEKTAAGRGTVDKRQANQERRINQGVKKGQLTADELTKLQGLETNIAGLEEQFKGDGKVTRDEGQQLRRLLNEASLQIWAERHDTEGNQKPAARLGKDVFAKDELTAKIESGEMTREQARGFLKEFRTAANLRRKLASTDFPAEERAKLQEQYNAILNQFFIVK